MIATAVLPTTGYRPHDTLVLPGPQWKQIEDGLLEAGIALPLFHRLPWVQLCSPEHSRLVVARDDDGRLLGGAAVRIDKSRVLPGYRYLRVSRLGEGMPREAWEPLIAALAKLVWKESRVLRLSVRVFSREHGAEIGALLAHYGFHREPHPTSYRYTLSIDLTRTEEEILAGLNKSARKNLRDADKSPLSVRLITDPKYVDRITSLELQAIRRTSGTSPAQDWASIVSLSRAHPELSRIVGLFLSDEDQEPEAMVGFAWGCLNGTNGEYRAGGTAHIPNLKVSISHRLVRDLILWSKRGGARWFDMGGVTVGEPVTHPLHGVSVFKRHFTHHLEDVGEEWSLEPHPARATFVRWLGGHVRRSTELMKSMRNMRPHAR
jgi:hypothetical protein